MSEIHLVTAFLGIATLLLLVSASSKGRDRLAFRVVATDLRNEIGDGGECVTVVVTGDVQNLSTKANCLSEIYLVSWSRDRLTAVICEPRPSDIQEGAESVELPLRFEGKQDRRVTLRWRLSVGGCGNLDGLEVALEDSGRKLYDQRGRPKNLRNIERRQELIKGFATASDSRIMAFLAGFLKVKFFDLLFLVRRILWFVGL